MAQPYRVCVARKDAKTGKTFWTRIGAAFKRDSGGMSVVLDAHPIGNELMIFPPDEGGRAGAAPSDTNGNGDDAPY
jgi:hypothetical protein